MVGAKSKTYLVSGGKPSQRRQVINNIKREIFKSQGGTFRVVTLYGGDIKPDPFKDLVFTFSFQKKKIILIKNFISLSKSVRKFIFDNFSKILQNNYLIFDSEKPHPLLKKNKKIAADDFFNYVLEKSIAYQGKAGAAEITFDDFRKKLYKNDLDSCLFILEELLSKKGQNKFLATQILGLITSKFSYLRESREKEEAFNQLWQTDRALKQSNVDIRLLMERLLVKLFA